MQRKTINIPLPIKLLMKCNPEEGKNYSIQTEFKCIEGKIRFNPNSYIITEQPHITRNQQNSMNISKEYLEEVEAHFNCVISEKDIKIQNLEEEIKKLKNDLNCIKQEEECENSKIVSEKIQNYEDNNKKMYDGKLETCNSFENLSQKVSELEMENERLGIEKAEIFYTCDDLKERFRKLEEENEYVMTLNEELNETNKAQEIKISDLERKISSMEETNNENVNLRNTSIRNELETYKFENTKLKEKLNTLTWNYKIIKEEKEKFNEQSHIFREALFKIKNFYNDYKLSFEEIKQRNTRLIFKNNELTNIKNNQLLEINQLKQIHKITKEKMNNLMLNFDKSASENNSAMNNLYNTISDLNNFITNLKKNEDYLLKQLNEEKGNSMNRTEKLKEENSFLKMRLTFYIKQTDIIKEKLNFIIKAQKKLITNFNESEKMFRKIKLFNKNLTEELKENILEKQNLQQKNENLEEKNSYLLSKHFEESKPFNDLNNKLENTLKEKEELTRKYYSLTNNYELLKKDYEGSINKNNLEVKEYENLKIKYNDLLFKLNELEEEIKENKLKNDSVNEKYHTSFIKATNLEQEINKLNLEKENILEKINKIILEKKNLSENNKKLNEETEFLKVELEKYKNTNKTLEKELEIIKEENTIFDNENCVLNDLTDSFEEKLILFYDKQTELLFKLQESNKKFRNLLVNNENKKNELEKVKFNFENVLNKKQNEIIKLNELIKDSEEKYKEVINNKEVINEEVMNKEIFNNDKIQFSDKIESFNAKKELALLKEELIKELSNEKNHFFTELNQKLNLVKEEINFVKNEISEKEIIIFKNENNSYNEKINKLKEEIDKINMINTETIKNVNFNYKNIEEINNKINEFNFNKNNEEIKRIKTDIESLALESIIKLETLEKKDDEIINQLNDVKKKINNVNNSLLNEINLVKEEQIKIKENTKALECTPPILDSLKSEEILKEHTFLDEEIINNNEEIINNEITVLQNNLPDNSDIVIVKKSQNQPIKRNLEEDLIILNNKINYEFKEKTSLKFIKDMEKIKKEFINQIYEIKDVNKNVIEIGELRKENNFENIKNNFENIKNNEENNLINEENNEINEENSLINEENNTINDQTSEKNNQIGLINNEINEENNKTNEENNLINLIDNKQIESINNKQTELIKNNLNNELIRLKNVSIPVKSDSPSKNNLQINEEIKSKKIKLPEIFYNESDTSITKISKMKNNIYYKVKGIVVNFFDFMKCMNGSSDFVCTVDITDGDYLRIKHFTTKKDPNMFYLPGDLLTITGVKNLKEYSVTKRQSKFNLLYNALFTQKNNLEVAFYKRNFLSKDKYFYQIFQMQKSQQSIDFIGLVLDVKSEVEGGIGILLTDFTHNSLIRDKEPISGYKNSMLIYIKLHPKIQERIKLGLEERVKKGNVYYFKSLKIEESNNLFRGIVYEDKKFIKIIREDIVEYFTNKNKEYIKNNSIDLVKDNENFQKKTDFLKENLKNLKEYSFLEENSVLTKEGFYKIKGKIKQVKFVMHNYCTTCRKIGECHMPVPLESTRIIFVNDEVERVVYFMGRFNDLYLDRMFVIFVSMCKFNNEIIYQMYGWCCLDE